MSTSPKPPYFLGIAGGSASGKTTLLKRLMEHFPGAALTLISQDNYYRDRASLPQSADGEDMAWGAVQEKLKTIISDEDRNNPLNDDEIVEKLKSQGIDIARRTVAKYRKILNIPTARQRKEY